MRWIAVRGEDVARDVVVTAHCGQQVGIGPQNGAELRMAAGTRRVVDWRDCQVMNHPSFIPAALIVNDEQARDVGEYVDERPDVVGIRWQAWLRFKDYTDRANRGQAAIGARGGKHGSVVDARDDARKGVRLKSSRIQQVVLEELARFGRERGFVLMSLRVSLRG